MAEDKTRTRITATEVAGAVILAVAGLSTSWASYQAALWDGEQAAFYSRANAMHVESSRVQLEADMRSAVDVAQFFGWLDATGAGDTELADFYRARFRSDFRPSFEAWLAGQPLRDPDAEPSPFTMPGYRPHGQQEAARIQGDANASFEQGQKANRTSDAYVRASVILASAMFFGGIGQVFENRRVRIGLATIAGLVLAIGAVSMLVLPVMRAD